MGSFDLLRKGVVIPAHPLALTADRKLDERRQVALTRYYCDAGAGGIAVGVHTTQFAIRDPKVGLLEPVLALAMQVLRDRERMSGTTPVAVAGICGPTSQALADAELARRLGFYLQPAVGGRVLDLAFWRAFLEIGSVVAVKVAPFNRYATLDVTRALAV